MFLDYSSLEIINYFILRLTLLQQISATLVRETILFERDFLWTKCGCLLLANIISC